MSDEVGDFIVKRGSYADADWEADARQAFMAEIGDDVSREEAERQFALWLAEGRTVPGGPLTLAEGLDRIVRRGA